MCRGPLRTRRRQVLRQWNGVECATVDHSGNNWRRRGVCKVSSACIQRGSAIERSHQHLLHLLANSCW